MNRILSMQVWICLICLMAGTLSASGQSSTQCSSKALNEIVDHRGWELPPFDSEKVQFREEKIESVQVSVVEYDVQEPIRRKLSLYSLLCNGKLGIEDVEVEVVSVSSYTIGNRTYAFFVIYNRIAALGGPSGKMYLRQTPVGYFDNDGDGIFETRTDAPSLFRRIPNWIAPQEPKPPLPPRKKSPQL